MIDRRSLGDVGLAVLLVLPTAALTRPTETLPQQTRATIVQHAPQLASADRQQSILRG